MLTKKALFVIPVAVLLALVMALALVPARAIQANGPPCSMTIYVNGATGNDDWTGTQPTGGAPNGPKQTIQAGINDVCSDGGTVYVAAGFYQENVFIPEGQDLIGAGAPVTIIDSGGTGRVITISSDPTDENLISGFTIQNGDARITQVRNNGYFDSLGAGINIPLLQLFPQPAGYISYFYCEGGGIATSHITIINDCTIRDNHACVGGGVYSLNQLTMNRCAVYDNTADWGGGGIANGSLGVLGERHEDGTLLAKINGYDHEFSGEMWLTNCTISGNSLTGEVPPGPPVDNGPTQFNHIGHTHGAGILNYGTMTLLNCTIAFNHTNNNVAAHGGGFANMEPRTLFTAYFKNTIVANNTAGDGASNNGFTDPFSTTISQGNNLDSENSCGFNQPTDQRNINPFLGPLQDNGGPTFTHAIECTSPAYNRGTNTGAPPTDQRGITRPQNGITDIGAYEAICAQPAVAADLDQSTGESEATTLRSPSLNTNNLAVNPSQTVANRPVTITANVVNEGGMTGSTRVALKINGQVEQTKLVTVGPGGSRPVKFTVTKAEPGTYTVIMGSQRASFLVTEDTASTAGVDSTTIVMILLGVLVVVIVMAVAFSFNRKPSN